MVNADRRHAPGIGQRTRECRATEQRADQSGSGGVRDAVDVRSRGSRPRQHRLDQRHGEHGRVRSCGAQSSLVTHDPEDAVQDTMALDRVSVSGLGMDGAVGPAQTTATQGFAIGAVYVKPDGTPTAGSFSSPITLTVKYD